MDNKPLNFALRQNPSKEFPRQLQLLVYISQFTSAIQHGPDKDDLVAEALTQIQSGSQLALCLMVSRIFLVSIFSKYGVQLNFYSDTAPILTSRKGVCSENILREASASFVKSCVILQTIVTGEEICIRIWTKRALQTREKNCVLYGWPVKIKVDEIMENIHKKSICDHSWGCSGAKHWLCGCFKPFAFLWNGQEAR